MAFLVGLRPAALRGELCGRRYQTRESGRGGLDEFGDLQAAGAAVGEPVVHGVRVGVQEPGAQRAGGVLGGRRLSALLG
ncbi:hypothetical protein AB0N06_33250 [Streptomyces sp. NPDC051020]|uniref:hypothetical protein n=1 Tax=Streptomyces sp. NPDC051020 TaxID=3155409 RepID=UPI0034257D19